MEQIGPRHFGGHRTTKHDKKAKKNIAKYLEGHDIIYYASWMDYLGYVTKKRLLNEWFDHCVPVNKDFEYAEGDFPGDALMAVEKAIDRMKDGKYKSMDDSTVLLLIKHLVHFPARHALSGSRHLQLPPVELLAESGRRGDSVPQRMGRHAFARPPTHGALRNGANNWIAVRKPKRPKWSAGLPGSG